ncbi:MAG: hypothetical protein ACOC5J_03005, partial [Gemmatimonadota bacterium]
MEVAATGRRWIRATRSVPWSWLATCLGIVALLAVPVVTVPLRALGPVGEAWSHVSRTLLPGYLGNTAFLLVVSGSLA